MTTRTSDRAVTFTKPFTFGDAEVPYPPGEYLVQTDEEAIEGASFVGWRRVATTIHVRGAGCTQVYVIDPVELDALLSNDAGPPSTG